MGLAGDLQGGHGQCVGPARATGAADQWRGEGLRAPWAGPRDDRHGQLLPAAAGRRAGHRATAWCQWGRASGAIWNCTSKIRLVSGCSPRDAQ